MEPGNSINSKINADVWDLLSKRWNLRILKSLDTKTIMRFNELKQSISGISANVLSERLDELERIGLVKKIIPKETAQAGYALTEDCASLKKILLELDEWISLWDTKHSIINDDSANLFLSNKLLEILRKEVNETEFNFIKDKLMFSLGVRSTDILNNFEKLKNIIIELYGDEIGNKILTKLNDAIKTS